MALLRPQAVRPAQQETGPAEEPGNRPEPVSREDMHMAERAGPAETPSVVVPDVGGANQVRVRAYNERLIMSLVRRHGALSKA